MEAVIQISVRIGALALYVGFWWGILWLMRVNRRKGHPNTRTYKVKSESEQGDRDTNQ